VLARTGPTALPDRDDHRGCNRTATSDPVGELINTPPTRGKQERGAHATVNRHPRPKRQGKGLLTAIVGSIAILALAITPAVAHPDRAGTAGAAQLASTLPNRDNDKALELESVSDQDEVEPEASDQPDPTDLPDATEAPEAKDAPDPSDASDVTESSETNAGDENDQGEDANDQGDDASPGSGSGDEDPSDSGQAGDSGDHSGTSGDDQSGDSGGHDGSGGHDDGGSGGSGDSGD
jgi:uncharacterized membrane protein YgcG